MYTVIGNKPCLRLRKELSQNNMDGLQALICGALLPKRPHVPPRSLPPSLPPSLLMQLGQLLDAMSV